MLSKEENDLLTHTGPGTPCGEFMRRYWHPLALADELEPDGPPIPVRILGEDLVLYRDRQGTLGLLGRWCSHRGTDLSYGEVEDVGLRCGYHGWLYDQKGDCLDTPLEPPDSDLRLQIHHKAYPTQERSGLIFGYLGPGEPPLLPAYEFFDVPDAQRMATKYFQECNYLQGAEGSIDPVQVLSLKRILKRDKDQPFDPDEEPEVDVEPTETAFGIRLVSRWEKAPGEDTLETRSFMFPSLCTVPGVEIDGYAVHWHVPMDDEHHWRYVIAFKRDASITDDEARRNGVERLENYRVDKSEIARMLQDPEPQETDVNTIAWQTMLAESQGAITDRSQEHLAGSDRGIVMMRTLVYGGIQDVLEGGDPVHVIRDPAENTFADIGAAEQTVHADAT
jgi:phenylpropionate dioxygenase-like ring-hydroxylating dioxygenase large terminal subunit